MSKAIKSFVATKVGNYKKRLAEAQESNSAVEINAAFNDYDLFFTGAEEALQAAGVAGDDVKAIAAARSVIDADRSLSDALSEEG